MMFLDKIEMIVMLKEKIEKAESSSKAKAKVKKAS